MKDNNKIIVGVVAVVIALGFFYVGMKYGEAKGSRNVSFGNGNSRGQMVGSNYQLGNGNRQVGSRNMMGGTGFVGGEILSKDDKSITVKLPNGGSRIIFTSANTQVTKPTVGSIADLTVGTTITVEGSASSDGSITANTIQIRPLTARTASTTPNR